MKEIDSLVGISQKYGADARYVIAGGGNTSYKNGEKLWVKASGCALASVTEDGFVVLDRKRLGGMSGRKYSDSVAERERQITDDLMAACITKGRRPSVETLLHDGIGYAYVVHTHPTLVNGLMCGKNAEKLCAGIFPEALFVPYADPGYTLSQKVCSLLQAYRQEKNREPQLIFLQNHGVFVAADSVEEIDKIYDSVFARLEPYVKQPVPQGDVPVRECAVEVIPAIRTILSRGGRGLKTLRTTNNALIASYLESESAVASISSPFFPDEVLYCKSEYIYLAADSAEELIGQAEKKIEDFVTRCGHTPKVLLIKGIGLVAVGDDAKDARTITDVFLDAVNVACLSRNFGGEHPMTREQIAFIAGWEAESYRKSVGAGGRQGKVEGKTIIVTGAAQGFGEGIARCLLQEGANVVVADLNDVVGQQTVERFNAIAGKGRAIFVKTNVSELDSISALVRETVLNFGALDVFVSNAGVARAGDLETLTPEAFDFVTKINYHAFFYCSRVASHVMKIQTKYDPESFCDIIQINSKSGLEGSKANYAYAGSKFGGIGLVQSYALELAPFNIKVNAICPGNYLDGPLWSDPEKGLFVQYLNAGKVPGAKNVRDVREFYLSKVPMRKGCTPEYVAKAIFYAIDQEGETGQAIPVTGGQVMLN